jgi:hypothetical protein
MKTKKTVISNYIPHKTPFKPNFNEWFNEYKYNLACLFGIFKETIEKRYSESTNNDWNSEKLFLKFCRFIYSKSSKHVNKWI